MGAQIKMGENARLELKEHDGGEIWQLWLDADIDHPNLPNPSMLCLGTKPQLNWIASSLALQHHIRFSPVE